MRYSEVNASAQFPYPDASIDPSKKGAAYCMAYAQAAYYDSMFIYPKGVFCSNNGDYEKFRMYALGKQPVNQYKKWMGVDMETMDTQLSVDWTIRAILSGYRDKAIARMMKEEFSIVATPVDMLAKTEVQTYYNELKAKLAVRQLMMQSNPELASHPLITLQSGEPLDVEELEMRVEIGEQFNRSKDAELAIELGFYENGYRQWRKAVYEDLFDYGVAGKKDWLGDDDKAKFRRVNPANVVVGYSKDGWFSDIPHAGELIDVSLTELAALVDEDGNAMFTEDELQEFAGTVAGKFGNPMSMGGSTGLLKPYDKFKCKVLDIEFFTYNSYTYRNVADESGNKIFYQEEDNSRGNKTAKEKYKKKRYQYVYKCKWIVGTGKCYDYGMCYDQKRPSDLKEKSKTKLSFSFVAWNFYEMRCQSMMERLIPYADDYQLTILRIQNWKARAVPSGFWIDLDALESIALNKGGENMQPKQILQMFFETGVLLGRSKDDANNARSPNWKPVIPIANSIAAELVGYFQDLQNTVIAIEKMTGYNDITSGNPNPKTLVPGYEIANESTNDALYQMAQSESYLSERLAEDVLCRMKQGISKSGKVNGYAPYRGSLGSNTLRFIELDKNILRDYGIELQKQSTEQEKIWLMQQVQQDIANGYLDTSDAILIISTHNAKQSAQILAFRVKKAKQAVSQQKMAEIQQTNQGNQQAAQIAQRTQMQILQAELQSKERIVQMQLQTELQKKKMEMDAQERIAAQGNMTKVQVGETTAQAKVISTAMAGQADIHKAHVVGEHAETKQELANEKPTSTSK